MKLNKEKINKYLNSKYISPVLKLLRQGTTPKEIACGIAVAFVLGIFPVLGSTTLLITGFALLFRMNLPLVQLVNFTVYPLQIFLIIPFMKLGESIFGFEKLSYSFSEITSLIAESIPNAIITLWNVTLQAIGAWAIAAPILSIILFYILFPIFKKLNNGITKDT